MPTLRFKTCRLLSGNVRNRELTKIQRRIFRRLRNKKRSIKRNIYPRENLNSYIQSQTTRKFPLFMLDLLRESIPFLISLGFLYCGIPVICFCDDSGGEESSSGGEPDAGIDAQESIGARAPGEGASNRGDPPSSQKRTLNQEEDVGPSRSTSWTEDSFEIGVLMEPFSETEMGGTSARSSIPRVAGDEAGPSHQGSVEKNSSLESSMRNRIARLEQDNSPYLLDKAKGEYWAHIKDELDHASSQREYSQCLEFENRDLRIRELKHSCSSCFQQVLLRHPTLADRAPYNPKEVFDDFLDERREALDRQAAEPVGEKAHGQGVPLETRDREEIAFLEGLLIDLQRSGPDAVKSIFQSPSPPNGERN